MKIVNRCLIRVSHTDFAEDGTFTFPADVTSIMDGAFLGHISLTTLTIPESVTSIGDNVFNGCTRLTAFTIPASVTSIGKYAFYCCRDLTTLTIPASVTSIGYFAFAGCRSLIQLTIPILVTSIEDFAFNGCTRLTKVTIPESVKSIGDAVFADCTDLTELTIPSAVISIGNLALRNCKKLTTLTIPSSVTSIGREAFSDCAGLTTLILPASVTSIGDRAFSGCPSLVIVIDTNDQQQFTCVHQLLDSAGWQGVVLTKVAGQALTTFSQNYVPPHLLGVKAIIDDLKPKVGAFLSEAQSMRVRMCVVTWLAAIPLLQKAQQTYPEALATIVNDHMSQHMRHLSHRLLLRKYQRTLIKKVNEGTQYTNCNGVVFFASPKPHQHTALWQTYQVIGKLLDYLDEETATLELDAKEKVLIKARSILMKCLPEDVLKQHGLSRGDPSLTAAGPGQ